MRTHDEVLRRLAAIEDRVQTEKGWRLKTAPVLQTESDTLRWVLGEDIPFVACLAQVHSLLKGEVEAMHRLKGKRRIRDLLNRIGDASLVPEPGEGRPGCHQHYSY